MNGEKSPNGVKIGTQPSWMKWNNTAFVNIVPVFNRGLPKAVQGNMHLGFVGNFLNKVWHLWMKRKLVHILSKPSGTTLLFYV